MNERQNELRKQIDAADEAIVAALKTRFALTDEMRRLKKAENLPRLDLGREAAIYARVTASVAPRDRETIRAIYDAILHGSRGALEP